MRASPSSPTSSFGRTPSGQQATRKASAPRYSSPSLPDWLRRHGRRGRASREVRASPPTLRRRPSQTNGSTPRRAADRGAACGRGRPARHTRASSEAGLAGRRASVPRFAMAGRRRNCGPAAVSLAGALCPLAARSDRRHRRRLLAPVEPAPMSIRAIFVPKASVYGTEGQRFESSRARSRTPMTTGVIVFLG